MYLWDLCYVGSGTECHIVFLLNDHSQRGHCGPWGPYLSMPPWTLCLVVHGTSMYTSFPEVWAWLNDCRSFVGRTERIINTFICHVIAISLFLGTHIFFHSLRSIKNKNINFQTTNPLDIFWEPLTLAKIIIELINVEVKKHSHIDDMILPWELNMYVNVTNRWAIKTKTFAWNTVVKL